jgi:aryl-alcohol dehydrogenase-like predicted oxidoreductase
MSGAEATLGLGCWAFGGDFWPDQAHRDSVAVLREALALGVTHYDTAASYGNGRSEQITGQQLRGAREGLTIATKGLYHPPKDVEAGIRKSLRRLLTGYVDIYYIHWPKPDIDLRPMVEALEAARAKGLIRGIGVSNFGPEEIEPLLEAGRIDYCQFGYNLLWRVAEAELIPFCGEHGIRMIPYGSLAEGLLGGEERLPSRLAPDDRRRRLRLLGPDCEGLTEATLKGILSIAADAGVSPAQLALMWNLSRPWADTVLFGARNTRQLRENLRAAERLDGEGLAGPLEGRLQQTTAQLSRKFGPSENIFGHRPR